VKIFAHICVADSDELCGSLVYYVPDKLKPFLLSKKHEMKKGAEKELGWENRLILPFHFSLTRVGGSGRM
jgi:hypothetical protein